MNFIFNLIPRKYLIRISIFLRPILKIYFKGPSFPATKKGMTLHACLAQWKSTRFVIERSSVQSRECAFNPGRQCASRRREQSTPRPPSNHHPHQISSKLTKNPKKIVYEHQEETTKRLEMFFCVLIAKFVSRIDVNTLSM